MTAPTMPPLITAKVFTDHTGYVTIGENNIPVFGQDEDSARNQVLTIVHEEARRVGHAVRMRVTDPQGSALVEVDPEGRAVGIAEPPPQPDAVPAPAPAPRPLEDRRPATVNDWRAGRPKPRAGRAEIGWQSTARKLSGGLWTPAPGAEELEQRRDIQRIQRSLEGPRTIVIANPKGGVTKSTQTLMLASTLGVTRGGSVLAWDNNENKGTLGARAMTNPEQTNTAVDLLRDLPRFAGVEARVGDLDNYVRAQGDAHFDVLVSTDDPTRTQALTADEYKQLHAFLSRFYRLIVVDTGNSVIAPNWMAAIESAHQLVVPVSLSEDSAEHASYMLDHLVATGHGELVAEAVTVLVMADTGPAAPTASVARGRAKAMPKRIREHFGARTRIVREVPADPALGGGREVDYQRTSRLTQVSWRRTAAAVADGL